MVTATPLRALIYVRQSRDSEDGIGRQLEQCEALCERNGWTIVGKYDDNDETADAKKRKAARPRYARLLADAEAGLGDVIVFQTTDRLLRDVREMEDFIDLVERTGIGVASTQLGPIRLDTVDGRMNARLGAVI